MKIIIIGLLAFSLVGCDEAGMVEKHNSNVKRRCIEDSIECYIPDYYLKDNTSHYHHTLMLASVLLSFKKELVKAINKNTEELKKLNKAKEIK